AGEHAGVEKGREGEDGREGCAFAQWVLGHLANTLLNALRGAAGAHGIRNPRANRQFAGVEQLLVLVDGRAAGVAVNDAGQAGGVVVLEESEEALGTVDLGGLPTAGLARDVAGAVAKDAGRLARLRVLLGETGPAVHYLEVPVDPAKLQRQRVERGIGAGGVEDRVLRGDGVQLGAGGVALL